MSYLSDLSTNEIFILLEVINGFRDSLFIPCEDGLYMPEENANQWYEAIDEFFEEYNLCRTYVIDKTMYDTYETFKSNAFKESDSEDRYNFSKRLKKYGKILEYKGR